MILTDILHVLLRLAELAFSSIVAGITGYYLHHSRESTWDLGRFIYTEVVAGLAILLALLWLLPFARSFAHWAADLALSACWFAAFGLLVDRFRGPCGRAAFDWSGLRLRGAGCATWRSDQAFAFLSAVCWLASALLGLYWVRRHADRSATAGAAAGPPARRRWYRR